MQAGPMKILFWICLLISCQCSAQRDYCRDIRYDENRTEGLASYTSPLAGKQGLVSVTKTVEDTTAVYSLYVGVFYDKPSQGASGIKLKLEDGTEIKSAEAKIICTMVDEGRYNLSSTLEVSDEDIETLGSSRITSISCAGIERSVSSKDADLFLNYVRCLMNR